MSKREVVKLAIEHKKPPYVPWSYSFTVEAKEKLEKHYGTGDVELAVGNHILELGDPVGFFDPAGENLVRDVFGVIWDRSIDKDIGNVVGSILAEPTLKYYRFPDPIDSRFFSDINYKIWMKPDLFRVYQLGFSLFERAWTLRGMENLMMDFIENPEFVRELMRKIANYNITQITEALKYDIDAVYFGDDWGQQHGLLMGPAIWREFIFPELKRMYEVVKNSGKFVMIHSCGDVDELFDELISIGLNCFNPFQPEVMDVPELIRSYKGRLAFHGGLSTQRTLPYGSTDDVLRETGMLLDLGSESGYILSPSHAVEGDVPLENMLAFIDLAKAQKAYTGEKK